MTNVCVKGKRVEREVANWLKSAGCNAKRSEQHCGAAGDSDVLCEELSSWHIECKGTKKAKLVRSQMQKWYAQATSDSSKTGNTPIIINVANNREWVAIITLDDWIKLKDVAGTYFNVCVAESIEPSSILEEMDGIVKVMYLAEGGMKNLLPVVYYGLNVDSNIVLVMLWAKDWLNLALAARNKAASSPLTISA